MVKLKSFAHIDFLSGCAATGWAVAGQFVQELDNIISWEAAGAFAIAAFGRWAMGLRKSKKESETE